MSGEWIQNAGAEAAKSLADEKALTAELVKSLERQHKNCVTCVRAQLGATYPCATGQLLARAKGGTK